MIPNTGCGGKTLFLNYFFNFLNLFTFYLYVIHFYKHIFIIFSFTHKNFFLSKGNCHELQVFDLHMIFSHIYIFYVVLFFPCVSLLPSFFVCVVGEVEPRASILHTRQVLPSRSLCFITLEFCVILPHAEIFFKN